MSRWARICQDCWQAINPDDYCPPLTGYGQCDICEQEALTLAVSSRSIEKPRSRRNSLKEA